MGSCLEVVKILLKSQDRFLRYQISLYFGKMGYFAHIYIFIPRGPNDLSNIPLSKRKDGVLIMLRLSLEAYFDSTSILRTEQIEIMIAVR